MLCLRKNAAQNQEQCTYAATVFRRCAFWACVCSRPSQLVSWGISDMVLILPRGSGLFCLGRAQRTGHIKPCTYNRTQRTGHKERATEKAAHSATAAIRWHALVWNPAVLRHGAGLIEHVNGDSTARVPITADAQPLRAEKVDKPLAN